jgi:hypothetical protein
MLFASVHVTFAAMTLFLMHSGGGPEYDDMHDGEMGEVMQTSHSELSRRLTWRKKPDLRQHKLFIRPSLSA